MTTKKTRARSPEKKEEQFNRIIEEGTKLFVTRGAYGFGIRALARRLNMSEANIYNYVESKRELWVAIRTKYLKQYYTELKEIIKVHQGSMVDLGVKWAEFFLNFVSTDYKRFLMMYLIPPPRSKKIGTLEKTYEPLKLMEYGLNIIQKAFELEGIKETEITEFFYYMFGVFFGAANVEAFLRIRSKIQEPIKIESDILTSERYRTYVLKEVRERLENLIK